MHSQYRPVGISGPELSSGVVLSWGRRVGPLSPALTSCWMQLPMEGQGLWLRGRYSAVACSLNSSGSREEGFG